MMDAIHKAQIFDSAHALIAALEENDEHKIEAELSALTLGRDNNLYLEVGKLTRDIHDAINTFNIDSRMANLTSHDIPNSRDRLNYVVKITEAAAHRTLEAVDNAVPATNQLIALTQTAKKAWHSLSNHDDLPTQTLMSNYFSAIATQTVTIETALSEITMSQEFQDLTGQVIRQVTDLIEEVEASLVKLIKIASEQQPHKHLDLATQKIDPLKAEGPQINAKDKPNVVIDQNEVDDLLSSLGF